MKNSTEWIKWYCLGYITACLVMLCLAAYYIEPIPCHTDTECEATE